MTILPRKSSFENVCLCHVILVEIFVKQKKKELKEKWACPYKIPVFIIDPLWILDKVLMIFTRLGKMS